MMQRQNDISDLDLQIRSLLQDASEKAPRGAWKAVRARIAEPVAKERHVWRWAGPALAFAVLGLAFVFRGTFDKSEQPELLAQSEIETLPMEQNPVMEMPEIFSDQVLPVYRKSAPVPSTASEPESVGEQTAQPQEEQAVSATTSSRNKEKEVSQPFRDPFAEMMAQDARKSGRRHVAFRVSGMLSGNENAESGKLWMGESGIHPVDNGFLETSESVYGLPVNLGFGVMIPIGDRWSVGTGVSVSALSRKFSATYKLELGDAVHRMYYIGIPVNLYYNLVESETFTMYAYAGGAADYCFRNAYTFYGNETETVKSSVDGLMYSVAAGLGIEFSLSRDVALYLDPSLRYYLPCDHPTSIRTVQPLGVSMEAGLRFRL